MITSDDDTVQFLPQNGPRKKKEKNSSKSKRTGFKPFANLPFIYFIAGILLTITTAIFHFMDDHTAYIVSGIIGITISCFGIKHFRTLLSLKREIDEFGKLNMEFRKEHNLIKHSVDRLAAANANLRETHNRLSMANEKNRQNLANFRGIQHNMDQFNAQSVAQLTDVVKQSDLIERKWHDQLYKHERHMLHTVFDRFCSYQNHVGMTRKEFDEFSRQLPIEYQERFARLGTFDKLAGHKNVILLDDFEQALDIFAEMQANDCDIDFELKATKRKRLQSPSMSLTKKRTKFFSKQQQSQILKFVDEEKEEQAININLSSFTTFEDDREYDDDLIRYQPQIVITRRSTPGHRLDVDNDQDEDAKSPTFTKSGKHKFDDSMDLFDNDMLSPTPSRGGSPDMDWGRSLIKKGSIATFGDNPLIRDISRYRKGVGSFGSMPDVPPHIELMTTKSIDQMELSDEAMNRYMAKVKVTRK